MKSKEQKSRCWHDLGDSFCSKKPCLKLITHITICCPDNSCHSLKAYCAFLQQFKKISPSDPYPNSGGQCYPHSQRLKYLLLVTCSFQSPTSFHDPVLSPSPKRISVIDPGRCRDISTPSLSESGDKNDH